MLSVVPWIVSALVTATGAPAVVPSSREAAVLEAPSRHIRALSPSMHALLKRGYRESPTFAALVARIQESDVIVYVEEVQRLPGALEGRLMMLPMAHSHRYVRIQIALRGSTEDSVALLGHELQHAVEVADAANVRDQTQLVKLYERIGVRGGEHLFDTAAARQTGRMVRRELSS